MKVVAYSIKPYEKKFLIRANQKKHEITLISNTLNPGTAAFAEGKDAVLLYDDDDASAPVINKLADLGVKFIATRSNYTEHIDKNTAEERGIKLARVPSYSPHAVAEHTLALALALNRRLIDGVEMVRHANYRLNEPTGFNFYGKTVGIIGLGPIGLTAAGIFKAFGCRVLGYDLMPQDCSAGIEITNLYDLLSLSDIVSIHLPLNDVTKYLISSDLINAMKDGVMLINTSHESIVDLQDLLDGLDTGKIGYAGLDRVDFDKAADDEREDKKRLRQLSRLVEHPNVLITPNQSFLTQEALQEIANQTIENLDMWQFEKCTGDACACNNQCKIKAGEKAVLEQPLFHLP